MAKKTSNTTTKKTSKKLNELTEAEATELVLNEIDRFNNDDSPKAVAEREKMLRIQEAANRIKEREAAERLRRYEKRLSAERLASQGKGDIIWTYTRIGTDGENRIVSYPRTRAFRSFKDMWDEIVDMSESATGLKVRINPELMSGYGCRNGEFDTCWFLEDYTQDQDPSKVVFRYKADKESPEYEFYVRWEFVPSSK